MNKQIEIYESLPEKQKLIALAMAMKQRFHHANAIKDMLYSEKITQSAINALITQFLSSGFLTRENGNFGDYVFNFRMMLYLIPRMSPIKNAVTEVVNTYSYYNTTTSKLIKEYLLCLIYEPKMLSKIEKLLSTLESHKFDLLLGEILHYHEYFPYLKNIEVNTMSRIVYSHFLDLYENMEPASKINEKISLITENYGESNFVSQSIDRITKEYKLNFSGAKSLSVTKSSTYQDIFFDAHLSMINRDSTKAFNEFKAGIKDQSKIYKAIKFPYNALYSISFLVNLFNINDEKSNDLLQNILKKKRNEPLENSVWLAAYLFTTITNDNHELLNQPFNTYIKNHNKIETVQLICIAYIFDYKPSIPLVTPLHTLVKQCYESGMVSLALEASFALKSMTNRPEDESLYQMIQKNMTYQPILSHIVKLEEWEKKLQTISNLLPSEDKAKIEDKSQPSTKVFYEFYPQDLGIQPKLQTRLASGKWSKGRNIAMKRFFERDVEGMTEQDFKIASCIKNYTNYYESYFTFNSEVFVNLIGHPFIVLINSDIPIELVAAEPIFSVRKIANHYNVSVDVGPFDKNIIVVKETNTRYKVYNFDDKMRELINLVSTQKIKVPSHGLEKLEVFVEKLSKKSLINSDIASSKSKTNIKSIAPDDKLRLQLLPFGDGLKAEIYAKPFGSIPPYLKPGLGGKTLITNKDGEQLQVTRNISREVELNTILTNDISQIETADLSNDLITFGDPLDSLYLLDVISKHTDICSVEWPEGERYKIKGYANFSNLNLKVKSKSNWFELDGELKVDEDTVLTLKQLITAVGTGHGRFVELSPGQFLALSEELRKRLLELKSFTNQVKDSISINKFATSALGDFFNEVENLNVDKAWKDFQKRVENTSNLEIEIPENFEAELRPYQEDGFRWMTRLASWEAGACLADDMGLGKTIQTLAVLLDRSKNGSALVICPVSVVNNWISEATKFTPTLNLKVLGLQNRKQILESLQAGDVLVTSYGLLQSEEKIFTEIEFDTIVLDEAHVIKNFATKTSKAAMNLKAKFKIALTGTPIQNHLGEIWNIFNFLNPGLLGTLPHFNDTFVKPEGDQSKKLLKKLISPFILRRTKNSVLDELPPKTEIIRKVELSKEEMAFYEALRRQAIENMESNDSETGAKHLLALAEITKLRQASCNPALVNSNLNIESSKLNTFLQIVDELSENKHRALVFSQFVTHLSLVRKALDAKGIKYSYLDGSTSGNERERIVKNFQAGENQLFLISLKAGGLGLNLTSADFVIHLDPWWNPAVEDQASDRAHRIGQTKPVTVYRLVAENTIEEKILKLHSTKRNMAELLLEGSDQSGKLSLKELVNLIKGE